ncbi:MAG TPA: hypothetical protein VJ765_17910, partial [Chitinophagaceae bacterium]|nr:hypothetical protein [Chitinophagaceae bacterium]
YSCIYKKPLLGSLENVPHRFIAIYFIAIAVIFYLLWLTEIIPATLRNETPVSVKETGLFTNPVHVIDLAVVLPGIFITGLLLLRKRLLGYILAPVILSFFILMDITIGTLVIIIKQRGLDGSYILALIMYVLAIISAMLLYWYIKRLKITE